MFLLKSTSLLKKRLDIVVFNPSNLIKFEELLLYISFIQLIFISTVFDIAISLFEIFVVVKTGALWSQVFKFLCNKMLY